jgi:hypothetical protein
VYGKTFDKSYPSSFLVFFIDRCNPFYQRYLLIVVDGVYVYNYQYNFGEFGTDYQTEKDKQWFQVFYDYILRNKLSWIFWGLTPDSVDTGGLLLNDWVGVDQTKQNLLKKIQYPLIEFDARVRPTLIP